MIKKNCIVLMLSTHYSCQILMKLECSRQIFKKYSNFKFHENPFSGSRVVPCGRTVRQDEANSPLPFHLSRCSPFWALAPSEDVSIFLCLLLISFILIFLRSVTCPSGRRPPIWFLVFPLELYNEIFI
jgi:hypothetical protein